MKFKKIISKCLLLNLLLSFIGNTAISSANSDYSKTLKSETCVSRLSDSPTTKSGHGTVVVDGKIYFIGGEHIVNSHTGYRIEPKTTWLAWW